MSNKMVQIQVLKKEKKIQYQKITLKKKQNDYSSSDILICCFDKFLNQCPFKFQTNLKRRCTNLEENLMNKADNIPQNKTTYQISKLNTRIHELESLLSQKDRDIENLKRSELTYHDIIDNMEIGYAHYNIIVEDGDPTDFIFLEVNETFEEILGNRYCDRAG